MSCEEFFSGKTAAPQLISLENGFQPELRKEFVSTQVPQAAAVNEDPKTMSEKELRDGFQQLKKENTDLKNEVSQKAVRIRQLESQLEAVGIAPVGKMARSTSTVQ